MDTPKDARTTDAEIERLKVTHQIDLEDKQVEYEHEWKSCCITVDKNMMVYFGQLSFAFAILAFCAVMLVKSDGDCNRSSPYIGLLSFMLGKLLQLWLQNKRLKKKNYIVYVYTCGHVLIVRLI